MIKEIEIPEGHEARIEGNKVVLVPKESEDERIRKRIIAYFKASALHKDIVDEFVSYLEKQTEVDFEDVEFLLDKVKYMSGLWVKTNPECTKIINAFNNRLNARKIV